MTRRSRNETIPWYGDRRSGHASLPNDSGTAAKRPSAPMVALVIPFADECELWCTVLQEAGLKADPLPAEPSRAFAFVRARRPDLVITRIHPRRTGIRLISAIRADRRTRHIPVLTLTSYPQPSLHREAQIAGADQVMLLPVLPDDLAAMAWGLVRAGHS